MIDIWLENWWINHWTFRLTRLFEAKAAYYSGDPIMSDERFDKEEVYLNEFFPFSVYFDVVGNELEALPECIEQLIKFITETKPWEEK